MKKTNLIEKIFLFSWPYVILFAGVTYIITRNWDYVFSFFLGAFSSLLMNSLNYRMMKNLFENHPELIKSRTILMYIAKFIFFGVILYVTYNNPEEWNVYFTFAGLFTYRIVSIPVTLIFAKKGDDEDA